MQNTESVMAEKLLMLALSPTMETGTIIKWNKQEGDSVETGDVLCEVETDKATMEYESMNDGTLLKIIVGEGGQAAIGQSIAVVGEKGEDISGLLDEIAEETLHEGSGATVQPPPLPDESVRGVTAAEIAGGIQEEVTGYIQDAAGGIRKFDTASLSKATTGKSVSGQPAGTPPYVVKASPLARKLAGQYNLDIGRIQGSGPGGRVIRRDIETARTASGVFVTAGVSGAVSSAPAAKGTVPVEHAVPGNVPSGQTRPGPASLPQITTGPAPVAEEIPVSGKRKIIAERLSLSKFSAPHYYLKAAIAVDGLMDARRELNKKRQNLTFNAFLVKFVAEALKRHPAVNSSWQGDRIVRFGRADIGIAVAQPGGLITPVLRDCWNMGIAGLDAELKSLVEKARTNKLKPDEYTGATFTISSLGTYGIHEFTAIINPPGSAILAVGQARREPVVGENDEIRIRTNMTVTLSCDHRVIDGAEGALFLNDLKEMIENPVFALY